MIKELVNKILEVIKNTKPIPKEFDKFIDISEKIGLFSRIIRIEKIGNITWTFNIFGNRCEVGGAYITVNEGNVLCFTDDIEKILENMLKKNHEELIKVRKVMRDERIRRLMKNNLIEEIKWYGRNHYKIIYNESVYNMCHGRGDWFIDYSSADWEKVIDKLDKMDVNCWKIGLLLYNIGGLDNNLVKIKKQYKGYKVSVIRPDSAIDNTGLRILFGPEGVLEIENIEEFSTMIDLVKGGYN